MSKYDKIKEIVLGFGSKIETLDFDYQIEYKNFKISITRNDPIMDDGEVFGVETNIFNRNYKD